MFLPVVPISGLAGWRFLQQTYDSQSNAFNQSATVQRDTDYFHENIAKIESAEELVSDRRLLSVALGAFGLQDDIDNRYFIQKLLEEGTENLDALANRLADARYQSMAQAFGFGPGETVQVTTVGFAEDIVKKFQSNGFEVAMGAQDDSLRIALYAQRTLQTLAEADSSTNAKWFTILGDPPMRTVFEKALNLPASIGQIDIDQQLDIFKERANSVFGSSDVDRFDNNENIQDLVTKFIARDQIDGFGAGLSPTSVALTLLRS